MQFSLTVEPQELVKNTQQTPNPAAQVPEAAPLRSEHSIRKSKKLKKKVVKVEKNFWNILRSEHCIRKSKLLNDFFSIFCCENIMA